MAKLSTNSSKTVLAREHERLLRSVLRRPALKLTDKRKPLPKRYSPAVLEVAANTWKSRLHHEHQSSAVFSRLLPQLIEAEATLDAKTAVLKMAMDELHHAALCAEVVRHLGGKPDLEVPSLATHPLPEHQDVSPQERALRNVLFVGCLSETVALSMLTEERSLTKEPFIRRVLAQLGADEVMHAKLGWAYVGQVWPGISAEGKIRTRQYLSVAVGYLRAIIHDRFPKADNELTPQLAELGLLPASRGLQLLDETLREVILPQLAAVGMTPLQPPPKAAKPAA